MINIVSGWSKEKKDDDKEETTGRDTWSKVSLKGKTIKKSLSNPQGTIIATNKVGLHRRVKCPIQLHPINYVGWPSTCLRKKGYKLYHYCTKQWISVLIDRGSTRKK